MFQTRLRQIGDGEDWVDPRQGKLRRSSKDRQPHFMRQWRLAHGLTLKEMAKRINERIGDKITSQPNLSRIENGEREYRQDLLEAYAGVLGNCTPADLLSRAPDDPEDLFNDIMRLAQQYRRLHGGEK